MTTVYEVAEDLVQYFIEHWDNYITNIYHRDTTKPNTPNTMCWVCLGLLNS